MFKVYAYVLIALGLLWWWRVDRRLARLRNAWLWRLFIAAWAGCMLYFPLAAARWGHFFPPVFPAAGFIWHVLVIGPFMLGALLFGVIRGLLRPRRRGADSVDLSRRQVLTALAAAAPPMLITGALAAASVEEIGKFRVSEMDLALPGWPPQLTGFTIAVVADIHVGPFSTTQMLTDIVARTNTIHRGGPADMVYFAGDLINTTLRDLPAGLETITALQSRVGTYACLGNHDVMADRDYFIRRLEQAGIPVLVDQALAIEAAPGVRVQLLGVDWKATEEERNQSVVNVAALRDPSLFPICFSHHPHAWDEAIRQGLPLMLSGHTHGGQIMLTKLIGVGPLKFRYWTGIYQRHGSTLVISNGVGNWFPLRVNAPPEILKLTLRPAGKDATAFVGSDIPSPATAGEG